MCNAPDFGGVVTDSYGEDRKDLALRCESIKPSLTPDYADLRYGCSDVPLEGPLVPLGSSDLHHLIVGPLGPLRGI